MYKIMTKLHTAAENIFGFYMVENDKEEKVEYQVKTKEEAAETALELLGKVGYDDLRIVDDQSYYLDLIYGKKPIPVENLYNLTLTGPEGFLVEALYDEEIEILDEGKTLKASNIKENESISAKINFNPAIQSFHLVINDKEYKTGLPTWIVYENIDDNSGKITFNGITRDYTIEVIIDEDIFVESK